MRRNKSPSARFARGFTIAELLTVLVLFGLLLTTVAAVVPAVLRSPAQMQAQVDEVDAAALALYKVQRDTRQSDVNGVFNCTTAPLVTCAQQIGSNPVNTQAIAIAGDDGSVQFVNKNTSQTKWQGYVVYWLAPSASGIGLDLMRAFVSVPNFPLNPNGSPVFNASDAVTCVTTAITLASTSVDAQDVRQLLASVTPANGMVALQLVAGVNRGDQTSITLQGNTYARN
jgi:prepilin-type N-terminal cleavage/methylation domain-containing protein